MATACSRTHTRKVKIALPPHPSSPTPTTQNTLYTDFLVVVLEPDGGFRVRTKVYSSSGLADSAGPPTAFDFGGAVRALDEYCAAWRECDGARLARTVHPAACVVEAAQLDKFATVAGLCARVADQDPSGSREVPCLASRASRLASRISGLASHVSHLTPRISRLASRVSRLSSRPVSGRVGPRRVAVCCLLASSQTVGQVRPHLWPDKVVCPFCRLACHGMAYFLAGNGRALAGT